MSPKRKRVAEFGMRGRVRCIVVRDGDRYVVERYVGGKPRRKSFPNRAEAVTYAERWYQAATSVSGPGDLPGPAELTLRDLFDRFLAVQAQKHAWRGSTMAGYLNHRKRIEEHLLPDTLADRLGVQHVDHLWVRLTAPTDGRAPMAPNQVRAKVKLLGRVLEWAAARDLIRRNPVPAWDQPEVRRAVVAEYQQEDADKLLAQWDYRDPWGWRPWAIVMIAGSHGFRVNAILQLRWEDVDLEAGRVHMASESDKTKREWSRPLTWDAVAALRTARWHADRLRKASPFVFYGNRPGLPYTYGAFWLAFHKAEARAGIPHVRLRAAHGLRRMVVNNVRQATGDAALALLWVGDHDLRQAGSYVRTRESELETIATRTAIVPQPEGGI